ncbi:MAG: HAMP domain-containing sensor histidine kinase [Lachnospiraceae bacterium]|nr:HAMP domain-containing sensor histidine kinase [Lachnospiraceae bacterium]
MAGLIFITSCTSLAAVIAIWKFWKLRREVYSFADKTDRALDLILSEKEWDIVEKTDDTLWGKINEKLHRTARIQNQKQAEILREKQQIKELISDISHQTKTPIANMKIYLEILQEETSNDREIHFLKNMEHQTTKLDFLLQSMIKMSRLETGTIQIQKKNQQLINTLGRAVAAVVAKADKKNLRIFVDCDPEILLPHDSKWTEEAVFNLLDNAVKYTQPDGSILLSVTRQELFTKISVKDTGKGIARERQAEIFTRFYREPEVHDEEGIGIGLYLTRQIAELQDGYVEVRSARNQGSEFFLYLPNESSQSCDN